MKLTNSYDLFIFIQLIFLVISFSCIVLFLIGVVSGFIGFAVMILCVMWFGFNLGVAFGIHC